MRSIEPVPGEAGAGSAGARYGVTGSEKVPQVILSHIYL